MVSGSQIFVDRDIFLDLFWEKTSAENLVELFLFWEYLRRNFIELI